MQAARIIRVSKQRPERYNVISAPSRFSDLPVSSLNMGAGPESFAPSFDALQPVPGKRLIQGELIS